MSRSYDQSLTTNTSKEKDDDDNEKSWWPITPPWKTPDWMKNQKICPHALK
jgi:hypothetical protein